MRNLLLLLGCVSVFHALPAVADGTGTCTKAGALAYITGTFTCDVDSTITGDDPVTCGLACSKKLAQQQAAAVPKTDPAAALTADTSLQQQAQATYDAACKDPASAACGSAATALQQATKHVADDTKISNDFSTAQTNFQNTKDANGVNCTTTSIDPACTAAFAKVNSARTGVINNNGTVTGGLQNANAQSVAPGLSSDSVTQNAIQNNAYASGAANADQTVGTYKKADGSYGTAIDQSDDPTKTSWVDPTTGKTIDSSKIISQSSDSTAAAGAVSSDSSAISAGLTSTDVGTRITAENAKLAQDTQTASAASSAAATAAASCTDDKDPACQAAWNAEYSANKAVKSDQQQIKKDTKQSVAQSAIMVQDSTKGVTAQTCGQFNTANCSTTAAINTVAPQIDKTASAFSAQAVSSDASTSMMSMNVNTTQAQAALVQAKALTSAASAENTVELINIGVAAGQAYRLTAHMTQQGNAAVAARGAQGQITGFTSSYSAPGSSSSGDPQFDALADDSLRKKCSDDGFTMKTCASGEGENYAQVRSDAAKAAAKTINGYVATNQSNEDTAQQGAVAATGIAMAATAAAITGHIQQKASDKAQAANLTAYAAAAQGTLTFNPEAPVANVDGDVNNAVPVANTVTSDPAADTGLPGNVPLVNPNLDDGGVASPAANPFVAATPSAAAASAGGYAGSAGGTSAAKKDDAAATDAAAKAQTGGNYASGDSAPRFSRAGGEGGGVGLDGAFADLLKKFQPDDKKDTAGAMVFGDDRSPASERNAVLRQDQNIFEAISKRTQIKLQQGAISFNDRT